LKVVVLVLCCFGLFWTCGFPVFCLWPSLFLVVNFQFRVWDKTTTSFMTASSCTKSYWLNLILIHIGPHNLYNSIKWRCVSFSILLSRPTNAQHIYASTIFLYNVSTPHVSVHRHHPQGVLYFSFAKLMKIIKFIKHNKSSRLKCLLLMIKYAR